MLNGKVIIVTGGSSGIGRAASFIFAVAGASVVVVGRSAERCDGVVTEIQRAGGKAVTFLADVTDERAVMKMVDFTVEQFGRLSGAFNNAGTEQNQKLIADLEFSEFDDVHQVNLRAVFLCMKYQIRAMRETGGGAIVNNASVGAMRAIPMAGDYHASKHGLIGLTRAGAAEARITGVRVNAVLPGVILTPMTESLLSSPEYVRFNETNAIAERHSIGRFGQPEDVANAAKWLLSDESSFINGVMLPVDGGYLSR